MMLCPVHLGCLMDLDFPDANDTFTVQLHGAHALVTRIDLAAGLDLGWNMDLSLPCCYNESSTAGTTSGTSNETLALRIPVPGNGSCLNVAPINCTECARYFDPGDGWGNNLWGACVYVPSANRCFPRGWSHAHDLLVDSSCLPAPTCVDGVQNGDELGADCGGSCPAPCETWIPVDNPSDHEIGGREIVGCTMRDMMAWGEPLATAKSKCGMDGRCQAFCNSPEDWTVYYPRVDHGRGYARWGAEGIRCFVKSPGLFNLVLNPGCHDLAMDGSRNATWRFDVTRNTYFVEVLYRVKVYVSTYQVTLAGEFPSTVATAWTLRGDSSVIAHNGLFQHGIPRQNFSVASPGLYASYRLEMPDPAQVAEVTLHCQTPRCDDNVKNGDEAGIDCGGRCLRACERPVIPGLTLALTALPVLMLLTGAVLTPYYWLSYMRWKVQHAPRDTHMEFAAMILRLQQPPRAEPWPHIPEGLVQLHKCYAVWHDGSKCLIVATDPADLLECARAILQQVAAIELPSAPSADAAAPVDAHCSDPNQCPDSPLGSAAGQANPPGHPPAPSVLPPPEASLGTTEFRIGIHWAKGRAVPSAARLSYKYYGDPVDGAMALADLAEEGQILLSVRTAGVARAAGASGFSDIGQHTVLGAQCQVQQYIPPARVAQSSAAVWSPTAATAHSSAVGSPLHCESLYSLTSAPRAFPQGEPGHSRPPALSPPPQCPSVPPGAGPEASSTAGCFSDVGQHSVSGGPLTHVEQSSAAVWPPTAASADLPAVGATIPSSPLHCESLTSPTNAPRAFPQGEPGHSRPPALSPPPQCASVPPGAVPEASSLAGLVAGPSHAMPESPPPFDPSAQGLRLQAVSSSTLMLGAGTAPALLRQAFWHPGRLLAIGVLMVTGLLPLMVAQGQPVRLRPPPDHFMDTLSEDVIMAHNNVIYRMDPFDYAVVAMCYATSALVLAFSLLQLLTPYFTARKAGATVAPAPTAGGVWYGVGQRLRAARALVFGLEARFFWHRYAATEAVGVTSQLFRLILYGGTQLLPFGPIQVAPPAVVVCQAVLLVLDVLVSVGMYFRDQRRAAHVVELCINAGYTVVPLLGLGLGRSWDMNYWWVFRLESPFGAVMMLVPMVIAMRSVQAVNEDIVRRNASDAAIAGLPGARRTRSVKARIALTTALGGPLAGLLAFVCHQTLVTACAVPAHWDDWVHCEGWTHPLFGWPACDCRILMVQQRRGASTADCPDTAQILHYYPRAQYFQVLQDWGFLLSSSGYPVCQISTEQIAAWSGHQHVVWLRATRALQRPRPTDPPLRLQAMPRLVFLDLAQLHIQHLPADIPWASFPELQTLSLLDNPLLRLPLGLLAAPQLRRVTIGLPICISAQQFAAGVPEDLRPITECNTRTSLLANAPEAACPADRRGAIGHAPGVHFALDYCQRHALRDPTARVVCPVICRSIIRFYLSADRDGSGLLETLEIMTVFQRWDPTAWETIYRDLTADPIKEALVCLSAAHQCPRRPGNYTEPAVDLPVVAVWLTSGVSSCAECPEWPAMIPKPKPS